MDATTSFTLNGTGELRLADTDSTHYVGFKARLTNRIWTLPSADGQGQTINKWYLEHCSWASAASSGGAAFSEFMLIGA
jgi:hypothetical protein